MNRTRTMAVLLAALALITAACGGSEDAVTTGVPTGGNPTFPPESFVILANADLGMGPSRLLIGVRDREGGRFGSPHDPITVSVAHSDRPDASQSTAGTFVWIIEGAFGLYRADFDFDTSGIWDAVVRPAIGEPLPAVAFEVRSETSAPAVGEVAPAPRTPTLDDFVIEELTTDSDPDPDFYRLSLDEAIGNGRWTVVVFSTPAYCRTATCGPLLDIVKTVAPSHPDVDFIHIEVYTNLTDVDFAPVPENLAPAVLGDWWNLPSEPWVFVIDEAGVVAGRFEGVIAAEEIEALL